MKLFSVLALVSSIVLAGCGEDVREVPGPTVTVEVPGPTVEVLVPVPAPAEKAVICQVWTSLSNPALSQVANTSQYLALTHSVKGDMQIGLDSISFTPEADDTKAFAEFAGTDASAVANNFSMKCNFKFEVTNAGAHVFSLDSDDGSRLLVNGAQIIDNGGAHGMTLKTGTVTLPVGIHQMQVLFYEGNGPKGLTLKVQRPAIVQPQEDL